MKSILKKVLLPLFAIAMTMGVSAQEQRNFGLYRYNLNIVNPAFTGIQNEHTFNLQHVAPELLMSYTNGLNKINSGIGLTFWNLKSGPYRESKISALYSYHFKLSENSNLSFGTELKYQKMNVNFSDYDLMDPGDASFSYPKRSNTNFDFDLGVAYQIGNFNIAAAAKSVLNSRFEDIGISIKNQNTLYNLYAAYEFPVGKHSKIIPSLFCTTDFVNPAIFDINVSAELANILLLGSAARVTSSYHYQNINAGVNIKDKVELVALYYFNGPKQYTNTKDINFELLIRIKIKKDSE